MITPEKRSEIVAEAKSWLGTKYHHQARLKGVGVDCAQFPAAVYEACGIIEPIDPKYMRDWHIRNRDELYLRWVAKFARPIAEADVLPGDFVVWQFGNAYSHGGIILDYPTVAHAWIDLGVTMDNLNQHEDLRTRPRLFFTAKAA